MMTSEPEPAIWRGRPGRPGLVSDCEPPVIGGHRQDPGCRQRTGEDDQAVPVGLSPRQRQVGIGHRHRQGLVHGVVERIDRVVDRDLFLVLGGRDMGHGQIGAGHQLISKVTVRGKPRPATALIWKTVSCQGRRDHTEVGENIGIGVDDVWAGRGERARHKKPGWQIIYNTQPRYRGRERFTLAHEFGHYLLHRRPLTAEHYRNGELSGDFDFECLPLQANGWKDAEKQREEEADTLASFLLMPIDDYRNQVGGQEVTRGLLGHVTDRYGVSLLVTESKWIKFTDTRAAMGSRETVSPCGVERARAYRSGVFIQSGIADS